MSLSNEKDIKTPSRVRLTRNRTNSDTLNNKDIKEDDPDSSSDGDESDSPNRKRVSHHHTPHKATGPGRVDSALTASLRPFFEGIYELRDTEYVTKVALKKSILLSFCTGLIKLLVNETCRWYFKPCLKES